jgi:WD40 repeat protein
MRLNRRLWTTWCLGVFLALVTTNMNPADLPTTRDHTVENATGTATPDVSAEWRRSVIPIGHRVGVAAVAFAPDGTLIASGNVDNLVRLWQAQTGAVLHTFTGHASGVTSVAFSHDGNLIANGSRDNTVRLWEVAAGTTVRTLTGHQRGVPSVSFSPNEKSVASGSEDNTVWVWDVQTGKAIRTLAGLHRDVPTHMFALR